MNNSATTRVISKIAFEYNGNDKGMAVAVASNFLLSSNPEHQYQEMKAVADRNPKVKKWALTGYISPPNEQENTKNLSDEELTDLAIEALYKIGVTEKNQYRLDIHNSTKQKHIHFIVNRIDINGKCTVKAHDIGKRFGEAVREVCHQRNIKTDVEIGIAKRAEMLKNIINSIKLTTNFDDLISEMKKNGYVVQLSKNEKIGISGMRIILESDINHQTQRQYKAGYKLSEISNILKIVEIKNIFEIKNALLNESKTASSLKELRENLYRKGWFVKIQYKEEFKQNQKNEIQDIYIKNSSRANIVQQKDGFFFKKYEGFSLSEIDSAFKDLTEGISSFSSAELKSNRNSSGFITQSTISETLKVVIEELIDDFLKTNYVAKEDEWWKKKRKIRR
jgi:hypothetical protein